MEGKSLKEIWFNPVTGKIQLLIEEYGNFECDIYGSKIPGFYSDISGVSNYNERKAKMNLQEFARIMKKGKIYNKEQSYLPSISILKIKNRKI